MLDRLDELVVKPVDGSGGKGIVIGPAATKSRARRAAQAPASPTRAAGSPSRWSQLSTVPTLIDDGLAPRHVDLRPFAVNDGDEVWVLPGGLTRVALPEGELVVNSSQGGGSKDTWVLGDRDAAAVGPRRGQRPSAEQAADGRPGRHPDDNGGAEQAQQQQQTQVLGSMRQIQSRSMSPSSSTQQQAQQGSTSC